MVLELRVDVVLQLRDGAETHGAQSSLGHLLQYQSQVSGRVLECILQFPQVTACILNTCPTITQLS